MTTFDGAAIARGWLSVAIASGRDADTPVLDRTVLVEAHPTGVRIVATDKYVLLKAWVPNVKDGFAPEPGLDEVPYATAVAIDKHGRGRGFLGHVLRLAGEAEKNDESGPDVTLNLGVVDLAEDEDRPTFAGMETRYVDLALPGSESLRLPIYESPFPEYRHLLASFKAETTDAVALAPEMAARLGKLGKIHGAAARLGFSWGGTNRPARLDVLDSWPAVDGLVMPCRWDLERDEPAPDRAGEIEEGDDA